VFTNTDLGIFESQPVGRDILNRAEVLNDNLDISELEVLNITATGAIIKVKANAEIYAQASLEVTFHLGIDLETVLSVTDLGEFRYAPNAEKVFDRIVELNPQVVRSELSIDEKDLSNVHAFVTVNADSQVYNQTKLRVTFTVHV